MNIEEEEDAAVAILGDENTAEDCWDEDCSVKGGCCFEDDDAMAVFILGEDNAAEGCFADDDDDAECRGCSEADGASADVKEAAAVSLLTAKAGLLLLLLKAGDETTGA